LWKDASRADDAAEIMKLTAGELFDLRVVDKIIDEGDITGAGFYSAAAEIKAHIICKLAELTKKDTDTLLNERYERFRKFGEFSE